MSEVGPSGEGYEFELGELIPHDDADPSPLAEELAGVEISLVDFARQMVYSKGEPLIITEEQLPLVEAMFEWLSRHPEAIAEAKALRDDLLAGLVDDLMAGDPELAMGIKLRLEHTLRSNDPDEDQPT